MVKPAYHTEEHVSVDTLLIVDKQGYVSADIYAMLSEQKSNVQVVLISENTPREIGKNLVTIPYNRSVPEIPQGLYTHMLIIYNGENELFDSIGSFAKEAKRMRAKLTFAMPLPLAKEQLVSAVVSAHEEASVVIIGELFGPSVPNASDSSIQTLLIQAKKQKAIVLPRMGMDKKYPVHTADATAQILEVVFQANLSHRIFFLFQKAPPTELSVARMIGKADPQVRIDFKEEGRHACSFDSPAYNGMYLLPGSYPLEKRLKQALQEIEINGQEKETDSVAQEKKESSFRISIKNIVAFIPIIILVPILSTVVLSAVGVMQLNRAKQTVERGNFAGTKNYAQQALFLLSLAQDFGKIAAHESVLLGKEEYGESLIAHLHTGRETASMLSDAADAAQGYLRVFAGASDNPKADFASASNSLKNTLHVLQKLKIENSDMLSVSYIEGIDMLESIIDILPTLLGFEGKREYLLLFQNNMELRPGGGFIGSYGILSIENGRVLEFSINDVYDADGQLKGHVEPPFAIRRYIPSAHWYLRDSNFSPDFANNASMSAFFLQQELGKSVDGIIGIDVSFVKEVLRAIGPIYVSSYNETVTVDNVYLITQNHAEKNFFPGSTQKKDFLKALFGAIQVNLQTRKDTPYLKLLKAVRKAIVEKHVQLAVSDATIQRVLTVNSFAATLEERRGESKSVINDYIGVSEANLGGNKANFFVKRNVLYDAVIDGEGSISGKLTIMYDNASKPGKWPSGEYKNYLRLIVPKGTRLSSITIDARLQRLMPAVINPALYEVKRFKPPTGLEVEESEEGGKTIFGFMTIILPQTLQTIEVAYVLPKRLPEDTHAFSYSLLYYKQPGTEEYPLSFSLSYPQSFSPYKVSSEIEKKGNTLSLSKSIAANVSVGIDFARQ